MSESGNVEAFPLSWPAGWPRTERYRRKRSKFKIGGFGGERDELLLEVKRLGGTSVILSTNIPLRRDGLPYAGRNAPDDPGVAVYFQLRGKRMVFACDTFLRIEENLVAIARTIEALRGIERWGASQMMERAFTGFASLTAGQSSKKEWFEVLGVTPTASEEQIKLRYRELARRYHPDVSDEPMPHLFAMVSEAYSQAKRARGFT